MKRYGGLLASTLLIAVLAALAQAHAAQGAPQRLELRIVNGRVVHGQSYVTRGTPQRQGRAWVELLACNIPVKDGGKLILRSDEGQVSVKTGPSDQVSCRVRLTAYSHNEGEAIAYLTRYELTATRLGSDGAYIEGRQQSRGRRSFGASFELQVPLQFNLDLETQGGGIDIEKLDGQLRAQTAGGGIRTGDITGPVRVETAGGSIDLGNIGQRVEAHTAGGHIRVGDVNGDVHLDTSGGEIIAGMIQGTVRAETAGGDIMLRGASGPVIARTAGGKIQLGQCGGTVRAETAGGNIHLDGARGRVDVQTAGGSLDLLQVMSAVRAETAAGRILCQLDANRSTFAASRLQTAVGDIQVFLPPNLPLNINAVIDQTAGHKINTDFPLKVQREGNQYFNVGMVRAFGPLEGGGPELDLHTSMGNIDIRKLNEQAIEQLKQLQQAFWKNWQGHWQEHVQQLQAVEAQQREFEKQQEKIQQQLEEQMRKLEQQVNETDQ